MSIAIVGRLLIVMHLFAGRSLVANPRLSGRPRDGSSTKPAERDPYSESTVLARASQIVHRQNVARLNCLRKSRHILIRGGFSSYSFVKRGESGLSGCA